MDERQSFIYAIWQAPDDDTARLVYADWLDEHGVSDLDAATAEFIRVSCSRGTKKGCPMPRAAYPWIAQNYKRLLPTLFAKYPLPSRHWGYKQIKGRFVHWAWRPGEMGRMFSVYFDFHRGFLRAVETWSYVLEHTLPSLIRADQPLVKFPRMV